jgi:hypothetical protein
MRSKFNAMKTFQYEIIHFFKILFSFHIWLLKFFSLQTGRQACKWFLEAMIKSDQQLVKHILFLCPTPEVREKFAKLLIHIIVTLVPTERQMYFEEDSTEMEVHFAFTYNFSQVL